ncbi:glycosyltransferase [Algoriphagus sp. AGSA1]|uniref:glycosyltransferase n=1 Tax=Algoriphagus sp. AGSA1 TaxID=2907213 RepID=UPI001F3E93A3|nr:glycosyltransferase [Algoriphagus sp. AGSA1]MCE7055089.1 glycosyltransferase [Algoriphagus sp. AGSA1]
MNSPSRIIFNPSENKENKYINIIVDGLEKHGFEVNRLDDFLSSWKHFKSIELVHLNWFENLDDSSAASMWKSYFRKLVVLAAVKFGKKKLVWTMHNRVSHEKKSGKLSQVLTRKVIAQTDAIVIHTAVSRSILASQYPGIQAEIVHIPHPDFVDVYGPMIPNKVEEKNPKLRLLFIGAIKPYKNIELLIDLAKKFPSDIHLTIAGNPNSDQYRNELQALAQDTRNITLDLTFIPDEELPGYIHQSDLLILPYSLESSLNSGTVILAFSYGRTVICPKIGTIDDLRAGDNVLDYRYNSESEHADALQHQVLKALKLWKSNPNSLLDKGLFMRELIQKQNNKNKVSDSLIELYESLIN